MLADGAQKTLENQTALAPTIVDTPISFRHLLRHCSRADHDSAERLFEGFLRAPDRQLPWFLATQHSALTALLQSRAPGDVLLSGLVLTDIIGRLAFDLRGLGRTPAPIEPAGPLDPLAVDYLVLGSRLGTETMRRQLFGDRKREEVPQYFLTGTAPDLWRRHCAMLDDVATGSSRAERIVKDTNTGFALFQRAALAQPR